MCTQILFISQLVELHEEAEEVLAQSEIPVYVGVQLGCPAHDPGDLIEGAPIAI